MTIREKAVAASGKREYKTDTVPVLGEVRVRSLTEQEFQSGIAKWFRNDKFEVIPERRKYDRVKSIQMCLVEPDDSLSFTDSTEDLDILVGLGAPVVDALWELARSMVQAPEKN